jgi:3-deoxy-manno-octulosonate cytidylyltransferase (CMP-KDO synthetase)
MSRSYVIIPARYASTRLPRKMLLRETGKTLLQHTYEAASAAKRPAGVIVATDHAEIAAEVDRFRGEFVMTSPDCASGTDRVAEVARKMPRADILVNVQGDEPEMSPDNIDRVIELLEQNPSAGTATLATPMPSRKQFLNPACVKVVFDNHGRAMYFSRSPIPFVRDAPTTGCLGSSTSEPPGIRESGGSPSARPQPPFNDPPLFYQHLGIYAYRRNTLLEVASLPQSTLEQAEKLEQLRMLQHGGTILVAVVHHVAAGIDTPADYAAFVARRRAAG